MIFGFEIMNNYYANSLYYFTVVCFGMILSYLVPPGHHVWDRGIDAPLAGLAYTAKKRLWGSSRASKISLWGSQRL